MLADGSPPLVTTEDRLSRVRQRAGWLRALLALSASLGALLLAQELLAHALPGSDLLRTVSVLLLFALDLAWVLWLRAGAALVESLGLRSPPRVGRGWVLLILLPCLFLPALLWAVYRLAICSRPDQLPPVVEEREQATGFRDDALVRVVTGSIATPVIALWIGARALGLVAFPMAMYNLPDTLVLLVQGVAALASALAAWQIVGAVTHNLAELQRREHARAG